MQQDSLFDLGHPAGPANQGKRTGRQSKKSQKSEQYQIGYTVTPTKKIGVTGKDEQNQEGYTVTPGYIKINNNHKIKGSLKKFVGEYEKALCLT